VTSTSVIGSELAACLTRVTKPDERSATDGRAWDSDIWDAIRDLGYPLVSIAVESGGSGGTVRDAIDVLVEVGRFAVAAPVHEAGLLGGWLLSEAGLPIPGCAVAAAAPGAGQVSLRRVGANWTLTGRVGSCAWGPVAERIVLLVPGSGVPARHFVVSVALSAARAVASLSLAGEPRADVLFTDVVLAEDEIAVVQGDVDADAFRCRGAIGRAAMMVGAMARIRQMTVEYGGERTQFGRPIRQFQAVAQSLAQLAEQSESSALAVAAATEMFAESPARAAGLAKITAGLAADVVTRTAHQIHGAIGMTREYSLHRFTRRLYAWSAEYGNENYWSARMGRETLREGHRQLWPRISGTSRA
jgi:acyl-CoA dehydrogenase